MSKLKIPAGAKSGDKFLLIVDSRTTLGKIYCKEAGGFRGVATFETLKDIGAEHAQYPDIRHEYEGHRCVTAKELMKIIEGSGETTSIHHKEGEVSVTHWERKDWQDGHGRPPEDHIGLMSIPYGEVEQDRRERQTLNRSAITISSKPVMTCHIAKCRVPSLIGISARLLFGLTADQQIIWSRSKKRLGETRTAVEADEMVTEHRPASMPQKANYRAYRETGEIVVGRAIAQVSRGIVFELAEVVLRTVAP
jgi:hypothetical protein